MPQFNAYPALQARTFDLQDIQRQSLQNQLFQSKVQQAQNPQADPRLAFDKEKDQRVQQVQHVKFLAKLAGNSIGKSPVQQQANHAQAIQYAKQYGLSTETWKNPGDPGYDEWLGSIAAMGEKVENATPPSGYQRTEGGLEFTPGGPADPAQAGRLAGAKFTPPELIRLQRAYKKAISEGDEVGAKQILGRIEKLSEKSGINLTVGPDGTVDFSTGSQKGKQQQERKETGILAIQSVAAGANLLRSLEESGDASISFTGRTARLIDSFLAQVTASAGLVNVELPPVDRYEFTGALAEKSAVVKSKAISLAFAMAVARQGSRPTDQDIVYFLDIIGARAGSSRQFAAALRSSIDEGMERFAIRHREETGSEWNWDAALKRNKIQYGRESGDTQLPEILTDEDYEKLPSGTEFEAPDGTTRRKP